VYVFSLVATAAVCPADAASYTNTVYFCINIFVSAFVKIIM